MSSAHDRRCRQTMLIAYRKKKTGTSLTSVIIGQLANEHRRPRQLERAPEDGLQASHSRSIRLSVLDHSCQETTLLTKSSQQHALRPRFYPLSRSSTVVHNYSRDRIFVVPPSIMRHPLTFIKVGKIFDHFYAMLSHKALPYNPCFIYPILRIVQCQLKEGILARLVQKSNAEPRSYDDADESSAQPLCNPKPLTMLPGE
jgi:hypothetical protein